RVAIGNGFTSGGWTLEAVDNAGDVGRYCSIAYDTSGSLHVAYYDATNYNLKYAKRDILTGTWTKQTVDGGPEIAGLYTSIAVNPTNNRPSIAYYDLTNSALKYAEYNGATWVLTTVDVIGDVGLYTAIRFDALRGNVYVLYYDASFEALKIAAKQITSSSWSKVDTIESGGVGLRPSFVVDNTGHLRMVYYDQQRGDLIYRKTLSLPLSGVEGDWTLYQ
ncbi:hypothetical protein HYR69_04330, partial [Candidatus Sumerlaeota bacterium]|nr:hypothetical protein [Candidatus Sumerlaeota bacterium]